MLLLTLYVLTLGMKCVSINSLAILPYVESRDALLSDDDICHIKLGVTNRHLSVFPFKCIIVLLLFFVVAFENLFQVWWLSKQPCAYESTVILPCIVA